MTSVTAVTQHSTSERHAENIWARNVLALLVFALTFHAPGLVRDTAVPLKKPVVSTADLPRFHEVHSYFWRGAAPSFAGLNELKQMGVKTVIDLRRTPEHIAAERKVAEWLGMRYVSLPMGNFVPSPAKQAQFFNILNQAARDKDAGPVYVHCSHGSDRTGFLTALWRVEHDHWSILEASAEMLEYGFLIHKLLPHERVDQ